MQSSCRCASSLRPARVLAHDVLSSVIKVTGFEACTLFQLGHSCHLEPSRSELRQAHGLAWHHGLLWPLLLPSSPGPGIAPASAAIAQLLSGRHDTDQEVRSSQMS